MDNFFILPSFGRSFPVCDGQAANHTPRQVGKSGANLWRIGNLAILCLLLPLVVHGERTGPNALNVSGTRQAISDAVTETTDVPAITLSPASVAFGVHDLNNTGNPTWVTLTNISSSTVGFTSQLTGANPAQFGKWTNCTATLAAGASCSYRLYFTPTVAGAATAALTITDNAGDPPQSVAVSGTGTTAAPAVTLSRTSVSFGNQNVSTRSAAQVVTITNSGGSNLDYEYLITGTNASEFIVYRTCTDPLPAGPSCTFSFYFNPQVAGAATAVFTITDNTGGVPRASQQTITLSGTAIGPAALGSMSCSAASETGAATDACAVTLTAPAPAGGFGVDLVSSSSAVTVPASVTVAAGATSVAFMATTTPVTTAQMATLTAAANGDPTTYSIQLNPAVAGLTMSSSSVAFGNVDLSSPSTQSVLLTSSGTAAVTISGASIKGTGFSMTGVSAPVTLNPGQKATLNVEFDPTTAGAATGAVTLTSNASSGGTATVTLTGTGEAPSYQVDVTWNAPVDSLDPVAGYNVYKSISGSNSYQLVTSSPTVPTSYTDTAVTAGTAYTYYVESVDAEGKTSVPSTTFSVTIP